MQRGGNKGCVVTHNWDIVSGESLGRISDEQTGLSDVSGAVQVSM
jgi:hypothetical protein